MSLNHLLTWMSARGCGSWYQFRAAVEEFHVEHDGAQDGENRDEDTTKSDLPVYQAVRLGLQRLAHVEFFSSTAGADWRVVPPALALTTDGDECVGILCGARPPDLCDQLRRSCRDIPWDSQAAQGMPDRIRLMASDLEPLKIAAKELGLFVQENAPASLLAAIPSVDDPRSRFLAEVPAGPGWTIESFVPSRLRWTTRHPKYERDLEPRDVSERKTGLFRFRMKYQRFHFLRWHEKSFGVQVQVGKYAMLRYRRVRGLLRYERARAVLSVPVSCRPPLLIERALILCTGHLPILDATAGRLEYDAPIKVARLAAGLLRQEMHIR